MAIPKDTKAGLLSLLAAAMLCACGGDGGDGGGGGGGPPAPFAVEGGWQGTASTGDIVQVVVLENGTLWVIAGPSSGASFFPTTLFQGTLSAANGSLSSIDLKAYVFSGGVTVAALVAGSYVAGTSMTMNATLTGSNTPTTLNVSAASTADYDYNQPAQLAAIAGAWPGFFSSADSSSESGTLNVQSDGSFSTITSRGCQISGTATPRASGKNVFNVSLTIGALPCALPGATGSGIAVITRSGATTQLSLAVTTPDRASGGAFFGRR